MPFEKLSTDLIHIIFSYISIRDCERFNQVYQDSSHYSFRHGDRGRWRKYMNICDKLLPCVKYRLSIDTYLWHSLPNVDRILDSMDTNRVSISGSRAVEFFVPGSCTEGSDWDFYAVGNLLQTHNFMKDMQQSGVKWKSTLESFIDSWNSTSTDVCLSADSALHLLRAHGSDIAEEQTEIISDTFEMHTNRDIINSETSLRFMHDNRRRVLKITDPGYQRVNVISGTLYYRGESISIQLMTPTNTTDGLYDIICNFYCSIVQCVITPVAAIHLYADDTYNMRGMIWHPTGNPEIDGKLDHLYKKYKDRGYTLYTRSPTMPDRFHRRSYGRLRAIGDSISDVILRIPQDMSPHALVDYNTRCLHYRWIELDMKLHKHPLEPKSTIRTEPVSVDDIDVQFCNSFAPLKIKVHV